MVEASSSLTKLLITKDVLALGQNSLQGYSFIFQASKAVEPVQMVIYFIAFFVGAFGTNKWLANRSTACSLYLFLYLPVLMTAFDMLQYSLPKIINGILVGLLIGMLLENQKFMKVHNAMKARFWGLKVSCLPMLGMYLLLPVVQTLIMLKPNQKLLSIITTVHCAFFTSMIIYQLSLHSISAYAQEIDAIIEELNVEKEKSVSSDSEAANKNDQLSESEQNEHRKDMWRGIGVGVFGFLCYTVIPLIFLIRIMRS